MFDLSLIYPVTRVDPLQTSRLGWTRGETYFDNYAPAIPKAVGRVAIDILAKY